MKRYCGVIWWLLFLRYVDRAAIKNACPSAIDNRRILIVRLDGIGDFVLWLDAARQLRRNYPPGSNRITLVANRLWAGLAREQPYFDEVWEIDLKRFLLNPIYRYRILRRIVAAGFATAINPTFSRDFLWGDAIIRASRAAARIGFAGDLGRSLRCSRELSGKWYTRLIPDVDPSTMDLRKNAMLLRAIGLECSASLPTLAVKGQPPPDLPDNYYVLCLSAGHSLKKWPLRNFARLAERIFAATGWTGVICGGAEDRAAAARLIAATAASLRDYTGKGSLSSLGHILKRSRIVIGNDTGALHIAAAVGATTVCIVGGGHPGRFFPYQLEHQSTANLPFPVIHPMPCFGCDWRCVHKIVQRGPAPCILNISVDLVWERTAALIGVNGHAPSAVLPRSIEHPRAQPVHPARDPGVHTRSSENS